MEDFISATILAFTLLFSSEIGDRTFLLTAIYCTYNASFKVFTSSFLALIVNSGISIIFGKFLFPLLLNSHYIEIISSIILLMSGSWMIWEAYTQFYRNRMIENDTEITRHSCSKSSSSFLQIFFTIFLAELGDRSQFATFALSTSNVSMHNIQCNSNKFIYLFI